MKSPTAAAADALVGSTIGAMSHPGQPRGRRSRRAAAPTPESPVFELNEFLQEPEPDHFSWTQDALEEDSEDVAAWGASDYEPDAGPFVWYRPAQHELPLADVHGRSDQPAAAPKPAPSYIRPEIEGLRSVAVLLIVCYHVWLGRVSGGVDAFLFISAFLLSASFARRLRSGSLVNPARYWLRTFTRLLPPAVVVILLTLVGARLLLPPSMWQSVIMESIASATYWQNILLSYTAVDYYAADASTASPLQHFWSLSLQGQVFLVWPLLFLAVALIARRPGSRPILTAGVLFLLIGAASFAFSIWYTSHAQEAAYFSTPARLWEVALGTLIALALPWFDRITGAARPGEEHRPRFSTLRALAGWLGMAGLISVGLLLDVQGQFPGWIAIWPLASVALIILAGYSGSPWGFDRVLTMRLPRWLAKTSYAMYLVHWPVLIFYLATVDKPRAGVPDGLAVILVSFLLSVLLTWTVDAQFKRPSWKTAPAWQPLMVTTTCIALVLGGALGWRALLTSAPTTQPVIAVPVSDGGGSNAPTAAVPDPDDVTIEDLVPAGHQLDQEWPTQDNACAGELAPITQRSGQPCDMRLPADADYDHLVIVVGNSHSRQWIPALESAAEQGNWQILNLSADGCWFAESESTVSMCQDYKDWALQEIQRLEPDLVVLAGTTTRADGTEAIVAGGEDAVREVTATGAPVLAIRDTPRWEADEYACAEAVMRDGGTAADADAACGAPLSEKLPATSPLAELEAAGNGADVRTADFTEQICPEGRCSPLQGNVAVYMDDNHLTRLFTSALAPTMLQVVQTEFPHLLERAP